AAAARRFFSYIESRRPRLDRLVLLGDFFDYWIGPRHLKGGDYREAIEGLRRLTRSGLEVHFIHGNRDYFVEEKFQRATGVRVAGAELTLRLGGREVLCAHGDFIYNKNPKYTAYRRLMRFGAVRAAVLSIPATVGKSLARGFRGVSRKTTAPYRWTRKDLLDGAAPHFDRGADVLIVGHIHRPEHLDCERGGRRRDLYVVGDWDGTRDVVEFDGSTWTFAPATG
ncbi:MAG TPA: metallophosphoesterase, partial [Planctomycetota bacterium]|nr:metallophosphoesterase [Planctomycetota bacterium]